MFRYGSCGWNLTSQSSQRWLILQMLRELEGVRSQLRRSLGLRVLTIIPLNY